MDEQDVDDPRLAEQLARTKPKDLLNPADFHADSGLFRYVLEGTPRSEAEGAVLREQIKTPFGKPYLPGSSLKGALRTALAAGIRHDPSPNSIASRSKRTSRPTRAAPTSSRRATASRPMRCCRCSGHR